LSAAVIALGPIEIIDCLAESLLQLLVESPVVIRGKIDSRLVIVAGPGGGTGKQLGEQSCCRAKRPRKGACEQARAVPSFRAFVYKENDPLGASGR